MIRISQIKMPVSHTQEDLIKKTAGVLQTGKNEIRSFQIVKKSIDARKKPELYYTYTVDLSLKDAAKEQRLLNRGRTDRIQRVKEEGYHFPRSEKPLPPKSPVVIGSGPAGLFCAYFLAVNGYRPVLLERGRMVEERKKDVEAFWKSGSLHPDSNVQFGEGGAGTFSDGKLNTLVKDRNGRNKEVLRLLVEAGAPEEILYDARPHIGTDILMRVVKNIREKILSCGGSVRFESKVTDLVIRDGRVREVVINETQHLEADTVVLAIGHSARDTFRMLYDRGVPMDAKSFAVGLRVEHPRRMINQIQYGMEESRFLPAASYKVTAKTGNGRGVYSFCMCPGGYVVNASSEPGGLSINGMSYSGRDGGNSNSAVIITVTPDDFKSGHPLAGVHFQQNLEKKAYELGRGQIPVETYGDFRQAVTGKEKEISAILQKYPAFCPEMKGAYRFAAVHDILPADLNQSFVEGMEQFDRILPGFGDSGVYVSGVESRTSSPVRIHRDESGQSAIKGLYPCGEGAGYAGGITSAAMDGMLTAEKIAQNTAV